jgi:nitrogenase subunit NifH
LPLVLRVWKRSWETVIRSVSRASRILVHLGEQQESRSAKEIAASLGLELLGTVPYDEAVRDAEQDARAPIDGAPASAAVTAIGGLLPALEAR